MLSTFLMAWLSIEVKGVTMPKFETQGLSDDYKVATGSFDIISRGDLPEESLAEILQSVSKLSAPEGEDNCPPTILVNTNDTALTFYVELGMLNCLDSVHQKMTPDEALKIMTSKISIKEFDISKGHKPNKNNHALAYGLVIIIAIIIVSLGFAL